MIEQLVNFVIRPPRADYSPSHDLLEHEFVLKGHKYERKDLEVTNSRGHRLQCTHYRPHPFPDDISLPCVIYCHGNSGCRADANEAAIILLPSNITVFTLDFSGSGLSEGDYVSLGWNEMEDLKAVVSHLRTDHQVSLIGLWGRSMGAVTSLMYGAKDPSIAGVVLDSPFSNLFDLILELVDVYKIRLPKFTVKVAVQYMRRVIQKKAQFDIMDLDAVKVAQASFIPALFGHATGDAFIRPHHSDLIFKAYAGDKNIIKFEGDHNSARPQFYYDSVTIFFYNVLHPPNDPVAEAVTESTMYYDVDGYMFDDDLDENMIYEIMNAGVHVHPSSLPQRSQESGAPRNDSTATEEAINQTRSRWQMSRTVVPYDIAKDPEDITELMKRTADQCDESVSCTEMEIGSGRESANILDDSWEEPNCGSFAVSPCSIEFAHFPSNVDDEERMVMEAIAASLENVKLEEKEGSGGGDGDGDGDGDGEGAVQTSSAAAVSGSTSSRLESFSQRLRTGFFKSKRNR